MSRPTGVKRALQPETAALLVDAIETHVQAAGCCVGQAREALEAEDRAKEGDTRYRLARLRATHELEAALHASALTNIACTLAELDALGFEVRGLVAVHSDGIARQRRRNAGEDVEEPKPS